MRAKQPPPDLPAAFLDACPEPLCTLDPDGRLVWGNDAWEGFMGAPEQGAPPESIVERVLADQRASFLERLRFPGISAWSGSMRVAGGELRRTFWHWRPDSAGRVHAIVRSVRDQLPDDASRRARALVQVASIGVIEIAVTGEIVGWNDAATSIFGYSAGEALGRDPQFLLAPDAQHRTSAIIEGLLRDGVVTTANPHLTKDGRRIQCEWQIVLLRDDDGIPFGTAAVVRNLTAVEEQRLQLEESTRLLQLVLDSCPIVIWVVDRDGQFTVSRGSGLRLLGISEGEVVGGNVFELYADAPDVLAGVRDALHGLASVRTTVRGEVTWHTHFIPLRERVGGVAGMLGVSLDVTDRVRVERELRATIALIEQQRDTIREMSTPVLQIWDEVLALPVIGHVDAARTEAMMDRLLAEIVRTQSRFAILDVTGVEAVDTATVHHLVRLMRAVALLGAEGVLTGLSPSVARSLASTDVDLPGVPTLPNLRAGLERCLRAGGPPRPARGRAG